MDISARVRWCRYKLEIPQKQVYATLEIPASTFHQMENSYIGNNFFRVYSISEYFNILWQKKFGTLNNYPPLPNEETPIREITFTWIMLGMDPYVAEYNRNMEELERDKAQLAEFYK